MSLGVVKRSTANLTRKVATLFSLPVRALTLLTSGPDSGIMAGSRREVEDRSDSGSPAPSSQTRRSGRRARKRKVHTPCLELNQISGGMLITIHERQRGEDDFGGGEDEGEDEDEAATDQSVAENESSASSDEGGDGEVWQGDEDDEVERLSKALCMYAASDTSCCNCLEVYEKLNADII